MAKNIYDYIIILTIISVIFAGKIFGAFVPIKIIGCVASVYFLFFFSKLKVTFLRRNRRVISFLGLFLFYAVLSALWTEDTKEYLIATLSLYCYVFDFLLILYCAQRARSAINSILLGWIIFIILNLSCAFWEISTGEHFLTGSFQADAMERDIYGLQAYRVYAAVTYGNYNSFSLLLCLTLLFLLLYIYLKSDVKNQLLPIALFFGICIVLLINTSRGSLICLALFLIPLWYVIRKQRFIKYVVLLLLVGVGVYLWMRYSDVILFLIERKLDARTGGVSNDPRWQLWKAGLEIASQWLYVGSGAGSMIHEFAKANVFILYAHNLWIQMLVEYGFLITFIFVCFYVKLVYSTLRSADIVLKIIGLYLLFCWPILTIIDEGYMKSFHWVFFASVYSICYCRRYINVNG